MHTYFLLCLCWLNNSLLAIPDKLTKKNKQLDQVYNIEDTT